MGQIQQAINEGISTAAKVGTVVSIGGAIGEKEASKYAEKELTLENPSTTASKAEYDPDPKEREKAAKELDEFSKNAILIDEQYKKLGGKNTSAFTMEESAGGDDIYSLRKDDIMAQKALLSAYYKKNRTSALKLGIKSIVDRITGIGEK